MAVKTLAITEDAYRRLRAQKGDSESFSEVIVRLTSRPPLVSFAGSISASSARRLRAAIEQDRRVRSRKDQEDVIRH